MCEHNKTKKKSKGQIGIYVTIMLLIVVAVVAFLPAINVGTISTNVNAATTYLENNGYAVISAGEYAAITALLNSIDTKADAAVVNAVIAANTANATLNTLLLHNENEAFLFPEEATVNATLTSGGVIDTFGAWAEIVDTNAVTLSSKFAANNGYLVEITTRNYSDANEIHIIEIATANDGTGIIGRVKLRSDWTYVLALRSVRIDAGDTIYYRMKSETAGATLDADFKYYFE
jgi:hypothetical protein